jgi:hypothetical protein
MPKFIWKQVFKIEPCLEKTEIINGYVFEVKESNETIVEKIFETISFDERHANRKSENEYAEETLSWLESDEIREILLRRMIYQRIFKPISVIPYASPKLENRQELIDAGIGLKRTVGKELRSAYAILDVNNSLTESETFWNAAFQGRTKGQQDEILRIADWYERSVKEIEPIKSFVLSWIGFNGLYGLLALLANKQNMNEADKFIFMIKELLNDTQAQDIINSIRNEISALETYNIQSEGGGRNWSSDLRNEMSKAMIANSKVLELVVRCVYGIRKQVFHEAPKTDDIIERVKIAKAALMPIGLMCLKNIATY